MTWRVLPVGLRVVTALAVFAVAGCAVLNPEALGPAADGGAEVVVPPEEPSAPEEEQGQGQPDPLRATPAVVQLQGEAQNASSQGDHERAGALLERALRLEPENPALWHNLAIVRYRQGEYAQAENLALRSNGLATTRRELERRNWELIAEARGRRGNADGAEDARRRAEGLAAGAGP